MPKRTDIHKILIIGSGPIIISQACEFDYSGAQAVKALKEEGYEVVLINSNPATIMTDPELADRTYIEPITLEMVTKVIEKERPDALLPTLGGQTALNVAIKLAESGILDKYKVEMLAAKVDVIRKAEGREEFRAAMQAIGLKVPESAIVHTLEDAMVAGDAIGFPVIVRPSFTLGGTGGGVAYNRQELEALSSSGLDLSMTTEIMVERSLLGWKEFELEVMRDCKDNVVIICSIENMDAMGVHTGDSITVAPAQTLTDREYQEMRDAAIAIIREIGVETGGSNVQFAVNPQDGELMIIEMNPRVSRSSALASKATGFPIAKIAAKLAVGFTLDEIKNDITRETYASFEPTIDYCVVKIPRFTFEKFPEAEDVLSTAMKSVGETMAIGRTFKEAFQKAMRSLETGRAGFGADGKERLDHLELFELETGLRVPSSKRVSYLHEALMRGMTVERIYEMSQIDPWFLRNLEQIVALEQEIRLQDLPGMNREFLKQCKQYGFSDTQLAFLTGTSGNEVRALRKQLGVVPIYKLVDTCAAEFESYTPYYYSTYEQENEASRSDRKKVMILGGGPNRIGQGIEFDYCCVHAAFALAEIGVESIMVNSNPETVSTDYDTSDKLYFEPLTLEDVMNIIDLERPDGVIVQFGGQTPLNLAVALAEAGVPIIGTTPDSIDRAEDRKRFQQFLQKLNLRQPNNDTVYTLDEALSVAGQIGYPVVVRPSYVLGGRDMRIVYSEQGIREFMAKPGMADNKHPVLIDKFLEDAIEVDVDAICDGKKTIIGGIMEHIEEAGIHSGDSSCVLPPHTLSPQLIEEIKQATRAMAEELGVIGLMNVQYAVKDEDLYILEVNPRASRTVPFVSKATGVPLAKLATKVMMGMTLDQLGLTTEVSIKHWAVKEAVFPFDRFKNVDTLLGPEMKSTGEVMGIDDNLGLALAKAQLAAGVTLPVSGTVFLSVRDGDKEGILEAARQLVEMKFTLLATKGTASYLAQHGVPCDQVNKISEGRPHILDKLQDKQVAWVVNTSLGRRTTEDSYRIRRAALELRIPYTTTSSGAVSVVLAMQALRKSSLGVQPIQYFI
ncbi:MAG: carbamoyl-phosphate synthase large subunit [Proteobacteria bacterium]|jgi:carbamoyl-phosphate synthase large subunit|nr:carbamoyl-phosphate synthase large subunit [Desulfocapsa sp.]MBU3945283.1 carbamoyl-phosphate synthase large subunit [Pseudomonadota bacterium]MCG2742698.1 carbamoyl-phosphate synthase large subunit [Desulfobacteraceae bacterium]MBU3983761.1 carbamoyl-phosphate synthase large subunit [Pseudomonadota bacterium]MBU4028623.1 carbamoyl-phosphate synthase large subunit [Pseudomonadota bacterium]